MSEGLKVIKVERPAVFEIEPTEEGVCYNLSLRENRMVKVKAGDKMCTVGMIRRGRNWGDYGGNYCAECPYFLHPMFNSSWDQAYKRELMKHLESQGEVKVVKCPKCGCTEIDDGKTPIINTYGELIGYDYDPCCKNCGYPVGDDWIEKGESR